MDCELVKQGFEQGSCQVFDFAVGGLRKACEATLRYEQGESIPVDKCRFPFETRTLSLHLPVRL